MTRDEFNAYRREWRRANPSKVREQNRRAYLKHAVEKRIKAKQQRESGYHRAYYQRNRERIRAQELRRYNVKRRAPYGECASCGTTARLVKDHHHESGKQRELICGGCNLALGHVGESIERLKYLIAYLEKHNGRHG